VVQIGAYNLLGDVNKAVVMPKEKRKTIPGGECTSRNDEQNMGLKEVKSIEIVNT
jgi:hypothetical protein